MAVSKTRAGHRSKSGTATSHHAGKPNSSPTMGVSKKPKRSRSWTPEQLSDANFLKVPASEWKEIQDLRHMEYIDASEDSFPKTLAADALHSTPMFSFCRVHKWFWDNSIETTCLKDTYRYRVIESATDTTILPKDEEYDPFDDDESKIKILYCGLSLKDHIILLLRRICPDASMEPLETVEAWQEYLATTIRLGYGQIKKSTTYGWARPVTKKRAKKFGHRRRRTLTKINGQLSTPPQSSTGEEAEDEESDY